MKICFLVLTHKPIPHLLSYAKKYPQHNFYVHVDIKASLDDISLDAPSNVFFIEERIDIKWAGFSMIIATLKLISNALEKDLSNEYFHLISGDDVVLSDRLSWSGDAIYMESINSPKHNYRMRFNAPHADNKFTRHIIGKIYTQALRLISNIVPTNKSYQFGSQWFSIRRTELEGLYNSISEDEFNFFKKKLCPDEHFFQYLVKKNDYSYKLSSEGNKRYIVFDESYQRGSSPIFLNLEDLSIAKNKNYWFARKVELDMMQKFYENAFKI